ncbi:putative Sec7 domain containing protein [Trypanosoma cruzi]|nr:putative Sec7 domain containing protein [Trypanosoma cruzi]
MMEANGHVSSLSSSDGAECWRRDCLVLSNQTQNLLVAIRSNGRFGANARFANAGRITEHPLLRQLKALQREIMTPTLVRYISEEAILRPFCDLYSSEEMGDTIVGVALASLSNLIDLRCSFITRNGLEMILKIVHGKKGEANDISTYEVVLARTLQLYVSCAGHPCARGLPEDLFIRILRRACKVALHPMVSPLLRRTAEQAMKSIVTSLYTFVVKNRPHSSPLEERNETAVNNEAGEEEESFLTGANMLRYICTLIMGSDNERGSDSDIQRSVNKSSPKAAAVQLEGLWLVQAMLLVVNDSLCEPGWEELLHSVQQDLCRALLVTGVSTENIIVLSLILRTVHIVVKIASIHVVPQTFSFIRVLHLDPIMRMTEDLRSGPSSPRRNISSPSMATSPSMPTGYQGHRSITQMLDLYERRELLLESLVEFCGDADFSTFCYAQYDLSRRFPPLFDRLCAVLVENCFYLVDEDTSSVLRREERTGASFDFGAEGFLTQMDALALEAMIGLLRQTSLAVSHPLPPPAELTSLILSRLEQKKLLMEFASLFRRNAIKEGIPFLLGKATRVPAGSSYRNIFGSGVADTPAFVLVEPAGGREVGACLYYLSDVLDKRALGEYLGELGRELSAPAPGGGEEGAAALAAWESEREKSHLQAGTVRFYEEQLKGFLQEFDYRNKSLLSCIRETAYRMCMPGEAQKIDRVMEAFARIWAKSNFDAGKEINPFCSEQGPFILAFSLIMLNTDQHSGKMMKPMKKEDFRRVHRDSDGGNKLPDEFLDRLYDDVKAHPIIMAEMIDAGFSNDVTWALEMRELAPAKDVISKDALMRCSMQVTGSNPKDQAVAQALHAFVFSSLWNNCLTAFSNTIYMCGISLEQYLMAEGDVELESTKLDSSLTPAEEAYNVALDGLCFLAKTATMFGVVSAVNHVILVLLSQLPLDMQDANGSLVRLGNQRFSLHCLEKMFCVLHDCMPMVIDAWGELGNFFSKSFLLGVFANEPNVTSSTSSSTDCTEVWEELRHNPRIVLAGAKRATSEGGWFAALWGSSISSERAKAQEGEERRAMERVKMLFPTMEEFLRMIDKLEDKAHLQFFRALCETGRMKSKGAAESYAASYMMLLITEVAIRRSTDNVVLECYMKLCQQVTSSIFATINQPKSLRSQQSNSNSCNDGSGSGCNSKKNNTTSAAIEYESSLTEPSQPIRPEAHEYWLSLAIRVVKALLRAFKHFICHYLQQEVGPQVLDLLTSAPSKVFTSVVAPLLSSTLLELLSEPQYLPHVPTHSVLVRLLNTLCMMATACSHPLVQWRTRKALTIVVKEEHYDILRDGEDVINALVTYALESYSEDEEAVGCVATASEVDQGENLESIADDVTMICRRLVAAHDLGSTDNENTEWHRVWIASLRGLCALVVLSRQYRDRSEALLCLQHCLLDSDIKRLPVASISLLYEDVVFPLTEQICAPSSAADPAPSRSSKTPADTAVNPTSSQTFVTSLLSSFSPRPTAKVATKNSSDPSSAARERNQIVAIDLKCRVVGLLPKVLLHYVKSLGETPEVLQELWQRILGTLYALYTAPTESNCNTVTADAQDARELRRCNALAEEENVLREAIQETIKNMIYVLSATLSEPECEEVMRQTPYFWTSTKNLLRTFDFAGPLLAHIDALDG